MQLAVAIEAVLAMIEEAVARARARKTLVI